MKKWIIVIIAAFCVNSTCFAQTNPVKKKVKETNEGQQVEKPASIKKSVAEAQIKFSMKMLESNVLNPRYSGLPIDEVIQAVENITSVTKGEFESTADFNARKTAALSAKYLGDLSLNDTLAFVVPVDKGGAYSEGLKYTFDADAGEAQLFALARNSSFNGIGGPHYSRPASWQDRPKIDHFDLKRVSEGSSTYTASNAYGATVEVTKSSSTNYGIASPYISFLSYKREFYYSKPTPIVRLKMAGATAQKELPTLKALLVMKAADPYVMYDFLHAEPTRDQPTEVYNQKKYLAGEVLGIVFYSGLTGEIIARVPEGFGKAIDQPAPQTQDVKPTTTRL